MDLQRNTNYQSRLYQEKILEYARQQNAVVFLPTGSGKTYISIMLMREVAEKYCRRGEDGHKVILFMAVTIQLLDQHFEEINNNTPSDVARIAGDLNVDDWDEFRWTTVMNEHDIIVMTPEVFKNALYKGYVKFNQTCLIVFDECHHAIKNHPMKKILDEYSKANHADRPRILGLTAVLLSSFKKIPSGDLQNVITDIENTFQGRVISSRDHDVTKYRTKPQEKLMPYKYYNDESTIKYVEDLFSERNPLYSVRSSDERYGHYYLVNDLQIASFNKVDKVGGSIKHIFENLGMYAAMRVCDYNILTNHVWKMCSFQDNLTFMLSVSSTKINVLRKCLFMKLAQRNDVNNEIDMIFRGATPKMKELLELLRTCDIHDQALIFVQQRITAKMLFKVLSRIIREPSGSYSHLKVGFITGFSDRTNYINSQQESRRINKENLLVLKEFNTGKLNLLASTQVLEEGIDVRKCNLVVQFDKISNFRSYIQSKGRARDENSRFILFHHEHDRSPIELMDMERTFENILKAVALREKPPAYTADIVFEEVEYKALKGKTNLISAPVVLETYFNSFIHDHGLLMSLPRWYEYYDKDRQICQFMLQFPPATNIKDEIQGPPEHRKATAKRHTAFLAVKYLHEHGELNEHLLPVNRIQQLFSHEDELFPYFDKNDANVNPVGTKKCLRLTEKSNATQLCNNVPLPNKNGFLYEICYEPLKVQYGLVTSRKHTVGLVTKRRINTEFSFPVYNKYATYNVRIKLISQIMLNEVDFEKLRRFHQYIFMDVLKLVKKFMIYSDDKNNVSVFIAPLKEEANKMVIDWQMVCTRFYVHDDDKLSSLKEGDLISPIYQVELDNLYIVRKRRSDLTGYSKIKDCNYKQYFEERKKIALKFPNSPLVAASAFRTTTDVILSRNETQHVDDSSFSTVHYPLELLKLWSISWEMYLKFFTIPAILHRLNYLYLADELGENIRLELGLNKYPMSIIEYKDFSSSVSSNNDNSASSDVVDNTGSMNATNVKFGNNNVGIIDVIEEKPVHIPKFMDIARLETVTDKDLEYYTLLWSGKLHEEEERVVCQSLEEAPVLQPLVPRQPEYIIAPTAAEILETLTTNSSDDDFNSELLETLGDSFLKFAVSLSLLMKRQHYNEGGLSIIKGKLLGNGNLFYIGRNHNLGSYIKMRKFLPSYNFCPPCFTVPEFMKTLILRNRLTSQILEECEIPEKEQKSGEISEETAISINSKLSTCSTKFTLTSEHKFNTLPLMNYDVLGDKIIADSVEALIGLYLMKCGVPTAYELLQHLEILVPSEFSYDAVMKIPFKNDAGLFLDINRKLSNLKKVEETLGYTFKNKRLLLQAFTHTSSPLYGVKGVDSYQNLEFIGDAVLDFLITTYIYQYFNLTPGKLTDLRSALVNNVTFACLAVRYEFYKYLDYYSFSLYKSINNFTSFQKQSNHNVNHAVTMLGGSENNVAATFFVPKTLGDVFESVFGAIFIDSDKNLQVTWEICYNMIKKELEEFSKSVPINPIRQLHESNLKISLVQVNKSSLTHGVIYVASVYNGDGTCSDFYGYGADKRSAKKAVAVAVLEKKSFRTVPGKVQNTFSFQNDEAVDDADINEIEQKIIEDTKCSLKNLSFSDEDTRALLQFIDPNVTLEEN